MSIMTKCDKCGKTDTEAKNFRHIRSHKLTDTGNYYTKAEEYIDVCTNCYKEIFNKEEK